MLKDRIKKTRSRRRRDDDVKSRHKNRPAAKPKAKPVPAPPTPPAPPAPPEASIEGADE